MRAEAGSIEGDVHIYPLRVYFEDTDPGGIVYYANYLRYAERARTEMLRAVGCPHSEMMARDHLAFAVRSCEVDYLRPARLDDELEVHTGGIEIDGASLRARQTVKRDGEDLVRMTVRLACVGSAGRPTRLPAMLRDALGPLTATGACNRKRGNRQ